MSTEQEQLAELLGVAPSGSPDAPSTSGVTHAEPRVAITFGHGTHSNHGTLRNVPLHELPSALRGHRGEQAWVIASEFENGERTKDKWQRGSALVIDVDPSTKDADGQKHRPSEAEWAALHAVAAKLGATIDHDTQHGIRLWFVLDRPCHDGQRFDAAAAHLCDRVAAVLRGTSFEVDRKASCNRAQLMFSPCALVRGVQRDAQVRVGGRVWSIDELLPVGWQGAPRAHALPPQHNDADAEGHGRPFTTFKAARDAYRRDNPLDVPRNSGACPLCGHDGGFGRLPGDGDRWCCFCAGHNECGIGVRGQQCWHGDVLDLDAHAAGLSPVEFLRAEGWLDPSAVFDPIAGGGAANTRRGSSPGDVLDRMRDAGPIRHLPTGIAALDAATGGGLPTGGRVVAAGPPDGGKTALVNQLADVLASQGVACGMLSVDEEARDQLTRQLQRRGVTREQVESADPAAIEAMRRHVEHLPLRFYGPEFTIEEAAADLHRFAQSIGARHAALIVDSVQTTRCAAARASSGRYEWITANVAALRVAAERYGFLVIATSEMNRGGYANPDKRVDDMAAGSGSGAIEYQARLLLSLRSVPGTPDLVELRVTKNKFGPRTREDQQGIVLQLDRARQTLTEVTGVSVPDRATAAQVAQHDRRALRDAALLAVVLLERPGHASKRVEEWTRAEATKRKLGGLGHDRFGAARGLLGDALVVEPGSRGAKTLRLDASKLCPELLAAVDALDKGALIDATARAAIAATQSTRDQEAVAGIGESLTSPDLPAGSLGDRQGGSVVAPSLTSPDVPAPIPGRSIDPALSVSAPPVRGARAPGGSHPLPSLSPPSLTGEDLALREVLGEVTS